jgi:hypothetical protein
MTLDEVLDDILADSEVESDLDIGDDKVSSEEEDIEQYRTSGKDEPCNRDSVLNYDEDFIPGGLSQCICCYIIYFSAYSMIQPQFSFLTYMTYNS